MVLTNSKITVGVNFNSIGFARGYLCLMDGFTSPQGAIQASYRIRQFKDNLVV